MRVMEQFESRAKPGDSPEIPLRVARQGLGSRAAIHVLSAVLISSLIGCGGAVPLANLLSKSGGRSSGNSPPPLPDPGVFEGASSPNDFRGRQSGFNRQVVQQDAVPIPSVV